MLVFTKAPGLIEKMTLENVASTHACMAAKGIMDVYPRCPLYITIVSFANVDVYLSKHRKVGKFANAPVDKVQNENKR